VIRSGFGKNDGLLAKVSLTLAAPFLKSPAAGAQTLVALALDPAGDPVRGAYLEKGKPVAPSAQAQDDELAAALWERSAQLTGVAAGD
jgi:hypothetical protein